MPSRYQIQLEAAVVVVAVLVLVFLLRDVLFFGVATFGHDKILWEYPVYQFYAENLIRGDFPFWNPFSHGGEPFYVILGQFRLLDPISFPTIFVGQLFTRDVPILFGWDHLVRALVLAFGVYIVLRPLSDNIICRLSLIPILLFSSFTLSAFRQDAFLDQAIWIPYVAFFLFRIICDQDLRWRNWICGAAFIGLSWQSYFFSGTWIFLLFTAIGLICFRRDLLVRLVQASKFRIKLAVASIIVIGMAMPMISLLPLQDDSVFPARMVDYEYQSKPPRGSPVQYEPDSNGRAFSALRMPYDYINHSGSFSTSSDFIQAIAPEGNGFSRGFSESSWGEPSEAFIYLGLIVWAFVMLGIISGKHEFKPVWLVLLVGLGLLLLGPAGGLHRILYYVYPPLWFMRHTHGLILIFLFCALYFYVLGFNRLVESGIETVQEIKKRLPQERGLAVLLVSVVFTGIFVLTIYLANSLGYPASNYLIFLLGAMFLIAWIQKRLVGDMGLYSSLLGSFIIVALVLSPNEGRFLINLVIFLFVPMLLVVVPMVFPRLLKKKLTYLPFALVVIFLTTDLIYNFVGSSYLYRWPTPSEAIEVSTLAEEPRFPATRFSYLEPPRKSLHSPYDQDMRYLTVLSREAAVFSSVNSMWPKRGPSEEPWNWGLISFGEFKNGSFESWDPSLEDWRYQQDGSGGSVQKREGPSEIVGGAASIWIQPSSSGRSLVRYETGQLRQLRGRQVVFSVSVKSSNGTPNGIEIDVQDNTGSMSLASYKNSADWERLEVIMDVDPNATQFYLTLNVTSGSTHGALFDEASLHYRSPAPNTTEYALDHKRWNSFFLTRSYFDLVNSGLSPGVIDEIFAVNKPLLQFKEQSLQMGEDETIRFLSELGSDWSTSLLESTVIINGPSFIEPAKAGLTSQHYASLNSGFESVDEELGSTSSANSLAHDKFEYEMMNYTYDSLEIRVTAKSDGFLYWADSYSDDWHAFLNGNEVPLYRANANFKAIELPVGSHWVSFSYTPSTFKWSLGIFYGLIIIGTLGIMIGVWEALKRGLRSKG